MHHVLFHVMPVAGNGIWQHCCDELVRRKDVFDGHRVCAIVKPSGRQYEAPLDPPEKVWEALVDHGFQTAVFPNDPDLREVATWGPLWDQLAPHADSDDVAFYCHAKGVTRPRNKEVADWTDALFHYLLDFMPVVDDLLTKFPVVGAFQKFGRHFSGSKADWFFAGSFYWVRLRDAFAANGPARIERRWYGVESWPGVVWGRGQAGNVHGLPLGDLTLHQMRAITGELRPQLLAWEEGHR